MDIYTIKITLKGISFTYNIAADSESEALRILADDIDNH
jgi:hypothetical protein